MKKLFDDKFKKIALYVVVSVIATALFLSVWLNIGKILAFSKTLLSVFSPIIYAIVTVLIVNPIVHLFHGSVFAFLENKTKKPHPKLRRAFSVVCGYLSFFIILLAVIVIVFVPLAQSVSELEVMIPSAVSNALGWVKSLVNQTSLSAEQKESVLSYVNNLLIFSPNAVQGLITKVVTYATSIVSETFNVVIGFIISIYFIVSMDYLKELRDKVMKAFFSDERSDKMRRGWRFVYRTFSSFITGRLVYSIILGITLFVALLIFDIPFYSVISIAMGMVAFVPVLGTVLSCAIGSCLCLLFKPQLAGWCFLVFFAVFLLFRIFVQPHVVKKEVLSSVGLSVFAVIIMFALFNVVGAIFAVPTFLVIKRLCVDLVKNKTDKLNEVN